MMEAVSCQCVDVCGLKDLEHFYTRKRVRCFGITDTPYTYSETIYTKVNCMVCDKTDSQGLAELYYQVGSHLSLEGMYLTGETFRELMKHRIVIHLLLVSEIATFIHLSPDGRGNRVVDKTT